MPWSHQRTECIGELQNLNFLFYSFTHSQSICKSCGLSFLNEFRNQCLHHSIITASVQATAASPLDHYINFQNHLPASTLIPAAHFQFLKTHKLYKTNQTMSLCYFLQAPNFWVSCFRVKAHVLTGACYTLCGLLWLSLMVSLPPQLQPSCWSLSTSGPLHLLELQPNLLVPHKCAHLLSCTRVLAQILPSLIIPWNPNTTLSPSTLTSSPASFLWETVIPF